MLEHESIEELKRKRESVIKGIKSNNYYTEAEKKEMIKTIIKNWKKEDEKKKSKVQN